MNRRFLLILAIATLLGACRQNDSTSNSQQQGASTPNTTSATQAQQQPGSAEQYPSLPVPTLEMLWEKCDYIDFIPYEFSFTMSQSEKTAIQGMLSHIAEEVPTIDPSCKPIGRIFYQVSGKNALEADLYIGATCIYYLFYENGKKAYANKLTDQGIQFYRSIFSQALQQQGQQATQPH